MPVPYRGHELLEQPLLNKDTAFTEQEREVFGLRGLLPPRVRTIEEQVALEIAKNRRKGDELERFIGLAALQDRNETLFYRVLLEHLEELMPIVYTPVVGRACQEYSHIMRRSRGLWLTPEDIDRIPELLANAGQDDVRLIVATDNERILGLGDQGCGGMGIPVGKLALYTAGAGIHPSLSPAGLARRRDRQPDAAGRPALPRLPAASSARSGVRRLHRGLRRGRHRGLPPRRAPVGGLQAAQRDPPARPVPPPDHELQRRHPGHGGRRAGRDPIGPADPGEPLRRQRFVFLGAGAASIGIARLVRAQMLREGAPEDDARRAIVVLDSRGLTYLGREPLDADKEEFALGPDELTGYGFDGRRAVRARGGRGAGRAELPHRHERHARDLHGGGHPRDGGRRGPR